MNPKLTIVAARTGGIFSRQDALASGYTVKQIRMRLDDGRWRRVRHGHYAEVKDLSALRPWERDRIEHRLAVHAAMRVIGTGPAVVSHQSALLLHGLPLWKVSLDDVHVTRRDGRTGRRVVGVCHHTGRIDDADVCEVGGLLTTAPPRALLEAACTLPFEAAVVSADAALREKLVSGADAVRLLKATRSWPGSASARLALRFADGRSESVGESRLRVLMDNAGLPAPDLQREIRDGRGLVGRVDFYFPEQRTVVEFDGMLKYSGDDAVQTLVQEKLREDRLRALGLQVVRVTWAELADPAAVAERIRQAFIRAAA